MLRHHTFPMFHKLQNSKIKHNFHMLHNPNIDHQILYKLKINKSCPMFHHSKFNQPFQCLKIRRSINLLHVGGSEDQSSFSYVAQSKYQLFASTRKRIILFECYTIGRSIEFCTTWKSVIRFQCSTISRLRFFFWYRWQWWKQRWRQLDRRRFMLWKLTNSILIMKLNQIFQIKIEKLTCFQSMLKKLKFHILLTNQWHHLRADQL